MKTGFRLAAIALLCFSFVASGQQIKYYGTDDKETLKEVASYYVSFARQGDCLYVFETRKSTNDRLLMKGYCLTPDSQSTTGHFTAYSESGGILEEGKYLNNQRTGVWKEYTDSGMLKEEGPYVDGKQKGLWNYYYDNSKRLWYTVDMVADVQDGTLKSYYKNGKLKRVEQLEKGKSISGKCYDQDGKEIKFTPFTQMPSPEYSIMQFLADHIGYPSKARKKGIEGRVRVKFVVNEEGYLTQFKIIKSLGHGCDEEVLRVMRLMPKWVPGLRDDEPVKVYYTQPVSFKLE